MNTTHTDWKTLPTYRGLRRYLKAGTQVRIIGLTRSTPIVTFLGTVGDYDGRATQFCLVRWPSGTETTIARAHLSTRITPHRRR